MKLNMEISYIPVSNIYQIRDMMDSWKTTSERCKLFSLVVGSFSLFASVIFAFDKEEGWWIHFLSGVLLCVGGYLCKKWKYSGLVAVMGGALLNYAAFALPLPDDAFKIGSVGVLAIGGLVPMLYAYKLMYNYKNVFKELEKLPGFPNFIVNTADLYADKMYMRDKEAVKKTLYDNKTEVSYNPFNTEEDYKKESFIRQQEYREERVPERLEKNITVESVNGKAPEKKAKTYKYGKSVLGRWLIFPHNAWRNDEFEEKKDWMGYWRMNTDYPANRFPEFMMVLLFNGMVSALIGSNIVFFILIIILTLLGTNKMKLDKFNGGVITAAAIILGFAVNINPDVPGMTLACLFVYGCALAVNNGIIFGTLRFLLNYPTYKQLSVMEGFPTFVRTTADIYGDKMYIVEKREPTVKKDLSPRQVKVMNIGYDEPEKEKKQDKGWNAFDYMDETYDR